MRKMRKAFTGRRKVLSVLRLLATALTLKRFVDIKELVQNTICSSGPEGKYVIGVRVFWHITTRERKRARKRARYLKLTYRSSTRLRASKVSPVFACSFAVGTKDFSVLRKFRTSRACRAAPDASKRPHRRVCRTALPEGAQPGLTGSNCSVWCLVSGI